MTTVVHPNGTRIVTTSAHITTTAAAAAAVTAAAASEVAEAAPSAFAREVARAFREQLECFALPGLAWHATLGDEVRALPARRTARRIQGEGARGGGQKPPQRFSLFRKE